MKDKLRKIAPPLAIPEEVQKRKSIASLFVPFLGKTVAFCTLIIAALHIAPFIPLSFAFLVCLLRCGTCMTCTRSLSHTMMVLVVVVVLYSTMFGGFLALPFIMTWLILSKLRLYDEIQSWMIAYIVWGMFTFMVLTSYVILILVLKGRKQKKYLRTVNKIIFFVVAIDFGAFDIVAMLT
eukprot:338424_1